MIYMFYLVVEREGKYCYLLFPTRKMARKHSRRPDVHALYLIRWRRK